MEADSLSGAVDRFIAYLRDERRYSAATIGNYTRSLNRLRSHIEGRDITRWREVHGDQIQAFIAQEHRSGLSPGVW